MSPFIPIAALEKRAAETEAFDLWLPHPLMGRALLLRLPLDRGWTFEFNPGEAEASRYVVYRDRMWVREGGGRFFVLRTDGSRVEINIRVRRWKPRVPECHWLREPQRLRLFQRWLGAGDEEAIRGRCCRTEREMLFWWKAEDARHPSKSVAGVGSEGRFSESDVELFLSGFHCH